MLLIIRFPNTSRLVTKLNYHLVFSTNISKFGRRAVNANRFMIYKAVGSQHDMTCPKQTSEVRFVVASTNELSDLPVVWILQTASRSEVFISWAITNEFVITHDIYGFRIFFMLIPFLGMFTLVWNLSETKRLWSEKTLARVNFYHKTNILDKTAKIGWQKQHMDEKYSLNAEVNCVF